MYMYLANGYAETSTNMRWLKIIVISTYLFSYSVTRRSIVHAYTISLFISMKTTTI